MKCPKCQFENPETQRFCGECGTKLDLKDHISVSKTMTLETPGEELTRGAVFAGRYEIIEELGRGGMGKIYRAYDKKIEGEVALKLVRPEIAAEKKTIDRFRNELKIAREIAHRSVCRMYDLNEEKGTYYITMEYVRGEDLKSVIRRMKQLTAGTAVAIARQIAEGLAEAHRLGVVHRDLKPSNIMIDREGNAKIMDFGIARWRHAGEITAEGAIIGTPEYMSPEQVEGKEADPRADIYALGVILYEMVTGRVPFEGDTPLAVAHKHKYEAPQPPRKLNPQVPEDLSRLILRCLEKDRAKRFQTAEELLTDLAAIEGSIPGTARVIPRREPLSAREITVKFRLKKLFAPGLSLVILAVGIVLVLRFFPKKSPISPPAGKPSIGILYFQNLSGDPSLDYLKTGLTELLTTDLLQSKFMTVLSSERTYSILKKLNLEKAERYSAEDLAKFAAEARVSHTASGSFVKAGEAIMITLTLQKPHAGEVVDSLKITCQSEEEIFAKTDELTRKIKSDLNVSAQQLASDVDMEAAKIMTKSPEAFKYFMESLTYWEKREREKAIALCEKAIELDPEFARAYVAMAVFDPSKGDFYRKKAFDLKDRLSERERLFAEANWYIREEETFPKAIEVYEKYFKIYPDDDKEIESLGGIYLRLEEWEKAAEKFELAYQIEKEDRSHLVWLAETYMRMGLYEKAEKILKEYIATSGDDASVRGYLSDLYLVQGKYDLALSEIEKGFALSPAPFWELSRASIYHLQGDLDKAEKFMSNF